MQVSFVQSVFFASGFFLGVPAKRILAIVICPTLDEFSWSDMILVERDTKVTWGIQQFFISHHCISGR